MTMVADNLEVEADNMPEPVADAPVEELVAGEVVEAEPEADEEAVAKPSLTDLLAGVSEDELLEIPVVKDRLRKGEKAAADREAAAAASRHFTQQQEFVVSGEAERELMRLAEEAADNLDERGRAQANPTGVKKVARAILAHGVSTAVSQLFDAVAAEVKDGFQLTQAETDFINAASLAYKDNPLDASLLQKAWMAPLFRAKIEAERENIRAEVKAEMKREQEAAGKAAKAAAAATTRSETPKPTAVNGVPISGPVTWESIDKTYTDSQWMRLPAEERNRLSAEANAARAKG